jgi:hypothetical protein
MAIVCDPNFMTLKIEAGDSFSVKASNGRKFYLVAFKSVGLSMYPYTSCQYKFEKLLITEKKYKTQHVESTRFAIRVK